MKQVTTAARDDEGARRPQNAGIGAEHEAGSRPPRHQVSTARATDRPLSPSVLRSDRSIDDKVLGALERLAIGHRTFIQDLATRNGLTPLQVEMLTMLVEGPPPAPHVGDLAREAGVTQPSASDALGALAAKGLVRRIPDESDRRRSTIEVTDEGVLVETRMFEQRGVLRRTVESMDDGRKDVTLSVLIDLIERMHTAGAITVTRNCVGCQFYEPIHAPPVAGGEVHGWCERLEISLPLAELRVNCPEHAHT
jgi:DNA-binding MarR family transcriptional regulator